ncbi:MAG TPA: hypothetical protein VK612_13220 [Pyrinomonadaceae bacterium]|nr:hypothetical protein [Pyrinomonadaceae bacterium]
MAAPTNGTVVLVRFPVPNCGLPSSWLKRERAILSSVRLRASHIPIQQQSNSSIAISKRERLTGQATCGLESFFTANEIIIARIIGEIGQPKLIKILDAVIALFEASK